MQISGGQLYLTGGGRERAINVRTGQLTSVAPQLAPSFETGDAGPTLLIEHSPCSAVVDSHGNLVVASRGLRVVAAKTGTFYGQAMTAGQVYRVMQSDACHGSPFDLACAVDVVIDHSGNLIVSFSASHSTKHPGPADINVAPARSGTFYGRHMTVGHTYRLNTGGGGQVAVDRSGNLLVAGDGQNQVGVIAERTGRFYGRAMTAGKLYNLAGTGAAGFSGDGGPAVRAKLNGPQAVAVDGAGNIVVGDTGNKRVRVVARSTGRFYGVAMKAGDIYSVIGAGLPAARARSIAATAVAVDGSGNLLVLDDTFVRALATKKGQFFGRPMQPGHVYTVAGNTSGHPGDGGPATSAQFFDMNGIGVDRAGNIAQTADNRVRLVAESTGTFYGQQMTAGDIYTVAGDGKPGFSGDGGPAVKADLSPREVTGDGAGNLLISDTFDHRVRVVAGHKGTFYGQQMTAGDIYTIAGDGSDSFSGDGGPAISAGVPFPVAVAVDGAGNLLIPSTGRLRVVAASSATFYGQAMTAGDIYTIAGDGLTAGSTDDGIPALQAKLEIDAVTTDPNGNVVLADETGQSRLRVVATSSGTFYGQAMTAGDIYTIAGDGTNGSGPAIHAEIGIPLALAADGSGNLVIADINNRILVVAASTGTFYGQAMTAGNLYLVAGGGSGLGDNGPATDAIITPYGMAITPAGDLVIADHGNTRIRLVSH